MQKIRQLVGRLEENLVGSHPPPMPCMQATNKIGQLLSLYLNTLQRNINSKGLVACRPRGASHRRVGKERAYARKNKGHDGLHVPRQRRFWGSGAEYVPECQFPPAAAAPANSFLYLYRLRAAAVFPLSSLDQLQSLQDFAEVLMGVSSREHM